MVWSALRTPGDFRPETFRHQCQDDLARAVANPALDALDQTPLVSDEAHLAAYELARSLGTCQWFLLPSGDDQSVVLTCRAAQAAAEQLLMNLKVWTQEARQLGTRWSESIDQAETDRRCAGLLDARNACAAVEIALTNAYLDAERSSDRWVTPLGERLDAVQDARDDFDAELQQDRDLLSTLTATDYLVNWRALHYHFAPQEPLPWWFSEDLDDCGYQLDRVFEQAFARDTVGEKASSSVVVSTANWPHVPVVALAASRAEGPTGEQGQSDLRTNTYVWSSPGGPNAEAAHRAVLVVPAVPEQGDETELWLLFIGDDQEPTHAFAGQPVELASCQATVGPEGHAVFTYGQLRQAAADLRLFVGAPPQEWLISCM